MTDNGGEHKDVEFLKFCREVEIIRHIIVKKTPQQNTVAKRKPYYYRKGEMFMASR